MLLAKEDDMQSNFVVNYGDKKHLKRSDTLDNNFCYDPYRLLTSGNTRSSTSNGSYVCCDALSHQ